MHVHVWDKATQVKSLQSNLCYNCGASVGLIKAIDVSHQVLARFYPLGRKLKFRPDIPISTVKSVAR